jgi:hypothetical protein
MLAAKLAAVVDMLEGPEVKREDILVMATKKGIQVKDSIKILKGVPGTCLTKKNPIVYNRDRLIGALGGDAPPQGRGAAPAQATANFTVQPAVTGAPVSPAMSEVKFTNTIIDATHDPSLRKFAPTKSYKLIERRLNPSFPLNFYVYGETGVGKSTAILYAAKKRGLAVVRANLSKFADVDDLFGGIRIVDGTTYFDKGPALVAMEMGAVLLLDEVDSADPQLLTDLHPILEKKGYLIKKIKQMVYPAAGFCVWATGNTAGRGDLTGRFIGTGSLNVAFLDRFASGIEYLPPTRGELKQIVDTSITGAPESIVEGICDWYEQISKAVDNGATEVRPSPRKVLDIIELMLSDDIADINDSKAKDCIVEGTNLMDKHISQAYAELWDSMLVTRTTEVQKQAA